MFSRRLASPFILLAFILAYWSWKTANPDLAYYLLIPFISLATIYVLQFEIDWWWAKDHPPRLHPQQEKAVRLYTPFYPQLAPKAQQKFRDRIARFLLWNEFIGKNQEEKVPDDIQAVIAAQYVRMTFGWEDYLIKDFQRIVVYNHAFPSPALKQLHSSELYTKDGVILFDVERLILSFAQPRRAYNLLFNEYTEVFQIAKPTLQFPTLPEDIWESLAKIRGFNQDFILAYTGKNEVTPLQASVEHFFFDPTRFKEELPEIYEQLAKIFNVESYRKDLILV